MPPNPVVPSAGSAHTRPIPPPDRAATSAPPAAAPAAAEARALQEDLNRSIIETHLSVSIRAGNEPLALLYRSAIEQLNELLAPELGENAIQNALDPDNTPAGTAGRIVSLSTGFFEAYQAQHPDADPEAVLENFMATLRRGFEQGYNEARDILDGLGVLSGDLDAGIRETYERVLKDYAGFEAAQRENLAAEDDSPATG